MIIASCAASRPLTRRGQALAITALRPPPSRLTRKLHTDTSSSAQPGSSATRFGTIAAMSLATLGAAVVLLGPQTKGGSVLCDSKMSTKSQQGKVPASSLPDISKLDLSVIEDPSAPMRKRMETYVKLLQHRIVSALGAEEPTERSGQAFLIDQWVRKEGGEGISCILQNGSTYDKAGVNISIVHGILPPAAVRQMSANHAGLVEKTGYVLDGPDAEVAGLPFYAAGLSLVVHPKNPFAPTVHFNYRYFELSHPEKLKDGSPNPRYAAAQAAAKTAGEEAPEPVAWWFGGGSDLTPCYLFEDDVKHFHTTMQLAADPHDPAFFPAWKKWCDTYFYIPHRHESRGVGGIFFDDLTLPAHLTGKAARLRGGYLPLSDGSKGRVLSSSKQHTPDTLFATVRGLGDAFIPSYLPILQRRRNMSYDLTNEEWQQLRRGRYVEFNLVYDRGTTFGLRTPGARTESILMSLPLKARWEYMEPYAGAGAQTDSTEGGEEGYRRRRIQDVLKKPREWSEA